MLVELLTVTRKFPHLLPSLMKTFAFDLIHVVSPTLTGTVEPTAGMTKGAVVSVIALVPDDPGTFTVVPVDEQQGVHGVGLIVL
jgi:hypothetical protein